MTCYIVYINGKKMVFDGWEDHKAWMELEAEHRRLTIIGVDYDKVKEEMERIEMRGMQHRRMHEQGKV